MDLKAILKELHVRHEEVDATIQALERVVEGGRLTTKRRDPRGRKSMEPHEREQVSTRMRNYWASRRAQRSRPSGAQEQAFAAHG